MGQPSAPEVRPLPNLYDFIPKPPAEDVPDEALSEEAAKLNAAERQMAAERAKFDREMAEARKELDAAQADIETAKHDAEFIRQQAETDAESVRQKAKMDGYAEGIAEAKEEYEQVLDREHQEFAKSVQALAGAKHEILEQMEPGVLDLAVHIAEKVVKESLNRNDALFMNIVKDTIKEVEDNEEIVLRLNKKDYDRFFADGENEYAELLRSSGVQIRQDMAVESGECIVETEFGTLRSGIKTQLERIKNALESSN